MPRDWRWITGKPITASISAMRRLTADDAMNSRSAARAMFCSWQTATNRRSEVRSSFLRRFSMVAASYTVRPKDATANPASG